MAPPPHTEIERKFLILDRISPPATSFLVIHQGYLSRDKQRTVRVRSSLRARIVDGEVVPFGLPSEGLLTIKGMTVGISRPEFNYLIPGEEAESMLASLCEGQPVKKHRYYFQCGDHAWDLDFFQDRDGLTMAEIELSHEEEEFQALPWRCVDVSHDPKYYNSNM